MGGRFGEDSQSYLAYLTNWRHADPLNFNDVIFGTGGTGPIRFWLALFPMNLAFIAEISNLHGLLLLGIYLEPFLLVSALLVSYILYEDLLQSEYLSIAALLLQFTFLFMLMNSHQPGAAFFMRQAEDKGFAAFILAPVFFIAIRRLLESCTPLSIAFTLLIGWALALTHPVILTFTVLIAGFYVSQVTFLQKDSKKFVVIGALLVLIMLPPAILRFIEVPSADQYVFDLDSALDTRGIKIRISPIEGTVFYGFNLQIIKILAWRGFLEGPIRAVLESSYLWVLGIGFIWGLFNLSKRNVAPFVVAASSLVILCAIPYTGWLLGYLVSARMLWRAPWMFPVGLVGMILLYELLHVILRSAKPQARGSFSAERITLGTVIAVCIVLMVYFAAHSHQELWQELAQVDTKYTRMQNLVSLGDYLEENLEPNSLVVAPLRLADYLPGISSKSKIVYFRSPKHTPYPVDLDRLTLIVSPELGIPMEERISAIKEFNIQYILVEDVLLRDIFAGDPESFEIQEVAGFWLIRFRGIEP
jgi:hypothetical protein